MRINKTLKLSICTLLITALLTLSVGKAERVSATATGVAIAATAALAAGAVFITYLAFTGGSLELPKGAERTTYIQNIGQKFANYPSGQRVYNDAKSFLLKASTGVFTLDDYIFRWTADAAKAIYNDFKNINLLQEIFGWDKAVISSAPQNGFNYGSSSDVPRTYQGNEIPAEWEPIWNAGPRVVVHSYNGTTYFANIQDVAGRIYRNVRSQTQPYTYNPQQSTDGGSTWFNVTSVDLRVPVYSLITHQFLFYIYPWTDTWTTGNPGSISVGRNYDRPFFPDAPVIDYTGEDVSEPPVADEIEHVIPKWTDIIDAPSLPVVPHVEIPSNNPNDYDDDDHNLPWGIPIGKLLEELQDLIDDTITATLIAEIINEFKESLTGDTTNEYNYYNNDDDTYNYYYSDTYYQDEYNYNYNIDITKQETKIPVDMNQIKEYTSNKYITQLKNDGQAVGDMVANTFAVVHNIDYEILYILFGGAILTLICALIGKAGK